eukprot:TRINITY_DN5199_c0_g1_i1.p1 TRINITY_DN5199_c0_g1~~TRINITY_DN5199_c0_g1_i1.p1  ORF type:complete len:677 (-),score=161.54 TRINITY_DN5199_c0_g1_i1:246-2276(-)
MSTSCVFCLPFTLLWSAVKSLLLPLFYYIFPEERHDGKIAANLSYDVKSLGELFVKRVERDGPRVAYYEKENRVWKPYTFHDFYDFAARSAQGMVELGVMEGDRVSILGPTKSKWCYLDMACHIAGVVSVGIYPKQTPEQIHHILTNSESKVVFVDGDDELKSVIGAVNIGGEGMMVKYIVTWTDDIAEKNSDLSPMILSWTKFIKKPIDVAERNRRISSRLWDHTAIIIYTSGTTGFSKGAMISHKNVLKMGQNFTDWLDLKENDRFLSFLPMAHAAERVFAFYGRVMFGFEGYFASDIGSVLNEVVEVKPTIFGSVPRIFEKAQIKIVQEINAKPKFVQSIFKISMDIGYRYVEVMQKGKVPILLRIQYAIAYYTIFRVIRQAFGGHVRAFITGAAPISMSVMRFMWAVGFPVLEVYGMTEATCICHRNPLKKPKLGTVGTPLNGIECKIAEDGEILIRGDWVFQGYMKNDEATSEVIDSDQWLHTGDIGEVDSEGYLKITDRKKHLIITAGGKNISPVNIELAIKSQDELISNVHAHGDRRAYITCLIAPSPIETLEFGLARGLLTKETVKSLTVELMKNPYDRSPALNIATAKVVTHPEYVQRIKDAVIRANVNLAHVESVGRFYILGRDFSQTEGEVTPTLKLKRKEIEKKFATTFDRIYDEKGFGVDASH